MNRPTSREIESWLTSNALTFWILDSFSHRAAKIIPRLSDLAAQYHPSNHFACAIEINRHLRIGIENPGMIFWIKSGRYAFHCHEVSLANYRRKDYPMPAFTTESVENFLRLKDIEKPMIETTELIRQAKLMISFGLSRENVYEALQCQPSSEIDVVISQELGKKPPKSLYRRCLEDGDVNAGIAFLEQLEDRQNRFVDINPDPNLWCSKPSETQLE